MKITPTKLQGLLIIQPSVFEDHRGYFFESHNQRAFEEAGIHATFVQDNQSLSQKGVLRGLHFQNPPFAQGKLVRVITGAVKDVAVDIRTDSSTYGKHFSAELTQSNKTMLWIPPGFAHGFVTLEDNTIFSYKCTNFYHKDSEGTIQWNDQDLGIEWPKEKHTISEKDLVGTKFSEFKSLF